MTFRWGKPETPRYSHSLLAHLRQMNSTVAREEMLLEAQEIQCWRMFGLHIERYMDEVLIIDNNSQHRA